MCSRHSNGCDHPAPSSTQGGETAQNTKQQQQQQQQSYPTRSVAPVGKKITSLYKKRLTNFFTPGQWEKVNLLASLDYGRYSDSPHIQLSVWSAPGTERPTFAEATAAANQFRDTKVGESFGPSWTTHWFRCVLRVPEELYEGKANAHIELHWDCSNEATVWTAQGEPLQGLTGRGERVEWIVPQDFLNGQEHTIYLEMACNGMFGNGPGRPIFKNNAGGDSIQPPDQNKYFELTKAELVAVNHQARMLQQDFSVIHDAAMDLSEDTWEQHEALNIASRIIDTFRVGDDESITKCREIAAEYLGDDINGADVYTNGGPITDKKKPIVYAVGHCHIDTCWLWPWAETRRKVVRSWSNQCDLMDRYPELTFACSQAQQFQWLKEIYPYGWERVKAKVKSGQFLPIGGSWVEHDTNLPCGESLVKQFLYGQRFFQREFGFRSTTSWLPDTFGFSCQIPQICRLAGMTRFLTQKPCFNSVNDFPHTTFNWVALDGSQVICHMPPAKTYCAEGNFENIKNSIANHRSLDQDNTALLAFGKGDGGGGPTWQHLERLRRLRGMADTMGGRTVPRAHVGATVDQFFDRLEAKASSLVTWQGELYFELHRGVYTTQAKTKAHNRKVEILLHDLEMLATLLSIQDGSGFNYPKKEIDEMWHGVMLCQFHDCLPGTAIEMCYDDSDKIYENVYKTVDVLYKQILAASGAGEVAPASLKSTTLSTTSALNTLPWARTEIIEVPDTQAVIASGQGQYLTLQPFDTFSANAESPKVTVQELSSGRFELENAHLTVEIERGCIISIYDRRAQRQVLSGPANQYVLFDDKPVYWQAWDVEVYHLETRQELNDSTSTVVLEDKGYRASVITTTKISDKSSIRTTISLSAVLDGNQSSMVECTADVDWWETMKFLKVEVPVNVRNTEASYETQYGVIRRPTHYNTSWDMAKFEVCCHKFADLSEHNYGVSVLNDSKYGFATVGNVMRLSLLRSPKAPDGNADMGKHVMRWAILPHKGGLGAETVRAAANFNNPMRIISWNGYKNTSVNHNGSSARDGTSAAEAVGANTPSSSSPAANGVGTLAKSFPIRLVGDDNLVLDWIKRGEDDADVCWDGNENLPARTDGKKSIVIRIYDALGGLGQATVETVFKLEKVFKTNIVEDDLEECSVLSSEGGDSFKIEVSPFEVVTYRLVLKG